MKICEQFASIQGEGKYIGVPSFFIRTVGCNLRCCWSNRDGSVTKCDTEYTSFNIEKWFEFDINSFKRELLDKFPNISHVVITGGEPLIQTDISEVIKQLLNERDMIVTIETNGTVYNPELVKLKSNVFMSFSPKLKSSYYATGKELEMHKKNNDFYSVILNYIYDDGLDHQLKYVVNGSNDDIKEIVGYSEYFDSQGNQTYLMPQGIDGETMTKNLQQYVDLCLEYGYNLTDRLHIRIWGNKREV